MPNFSEQTNVASYEGMQDMQGPQSAREAEIRVELDELDAAVDHLREAVAQIEERFNPVTRPPEVQENKTPAPGEPQRNSEIGRYMQNWRHYIRNAISRLDDLRYRCEL